MIYTKYYIKKNEEDYFEVFPTKRPEITKKFESGEHFYRYSFGEFEFRNNEKASYETPSNQKVFDILSDVYFTDEFIIKIDYNNGEFVKYGYFGLIDEGIKNDPINKTITITPTTNDDYTNLIEYWDTKVDVFNGGQGNKLSNGDFEYWDNDNQPTGWNVETGTTVSKFYYLGSNKAKLRSYNPTLEPTASSLISKDVSNINERSTITVNFGWLISRDVSFISTYRTSRYLKIKLIGTDSSVWYLSDDNKWYSTEQTYFYANNELPVSEDELSLVSKLKTTEIVSQATPVGGTLNIEFFGGVTEATFIYLYTILDNIIVRVNTANFQTIKVDLTDNYLKEYPYYIDGSPTLRSSPKKSKYDDAGGIAMYFDTFGAPSGNLLSDATFSPNDSISGLYLQDWIDRFDDIASSQYKRNYYKCQLSEVTVYECNDFKSGVFPFQTTKKRIYASVKFARDFAVTTDSNPPQESAGWEQTGYVTDKGEIEWARKPFNTEATPWELGSIETASLGTFQGFPVQKRLSSKRNYPISAENEIEFTTCIELRDVIKSVFNQTHPEYADKDVKSHFFWNDYPSEYPTFDSVINYVTRKPNVLNGLSCLHSFDLKRLESTEELTDTELENSKLPISFYDLMADIKSYFRTNNIGHFYWFLTDDKDLRLEHISYFYIKGQSEASERPLENISSRPVINYYDTFNYLIDEMPSRITFEQVNSGYKDFKDNEMTFDRIVSGKRGKEIKIENSIQNITTDLRYCIENKTDLENSLILINYETIGSDNFVINAPTQIQGTNFVNGNLSFSSILKEYCTYEGTFYEGYINDENVKFRQTVYNKEAIEIELKGIIDEAFIRSKIATGKVISVVFDFDNLTTKVVLRYSSRYFFSGGENSRLNLGFYV